GPRFPACSWGRTADRTREQHRRTPLGARCAGPGMVTSAGRGDVRSGWQAGSRVTCAWAGAIVLLALVLRLSFAMAYAAHPIGRVTWVDEGAYAERAQAILGGAWLPEAPFFQDPLYPYLLAGVMVAFGTSIGTLRIVFGILGSLTPVVVFAAARRGFGLA